MASSQRSQRPLAIHKRRSAISANIEVIGMPVSQGIGIFFGVRYFI